MSSNEHVGKWRPIVLFSCNCYCYLWTGFMGVGSGTCSPGFWNFQQLKVVFLVSTEKNQISPLLAPPWKNLGKIPYCLPPWKKSFRSPCLYVFGSEKHLTASIQQVVWKVLLWNLTTWCNCTFNLISVQFFPVAENTNVSVVTPIFTSCCPFERLKENYSLGLYMFVSRFVNV